MTRFPCACMIFAALAGCAQGYYGPSDSAAMKPTNGVLTIESSTGGEVYATQQSFQRMEREGVQVRIVGNCGSACILILTHRNICYAPDAEFVFHGASNRDGYDAGLSRRFEQSLPGKISQWSRAHGAMTDPDKLTRISGAEIAKLDASDRTCRTGNASAEDQTLAANAIAGLREALKGATVVTNTASAEIGRLTKERDAMRAAFSCVDEDDWLFLLSQIKDDGRGRFWKTIFEKLRAVLSADAQGEKE